MTIGSARLGGGSGRESRRKDGTCEGAGGARECADRRGNARRGAETAGI